MNEDLQALIKQNQEILQLKQMIKISRRCKFSSTTASLRQALKYKICQKKLFCKEKGIPYVR